METHVRPYVGSALDSKNIPVRDSGLSLHKLTLAESIGIIVGTNIGAGILGLAYASRKAGYLPLLLWLAVAGIFTCISMLYVAEICLRTKGNHQLSGLAEHHLGRAGAWLLFAGVAANSYGALTAYIAGSGEIMNSFFGSMGVTRPIGSLLFFIPAVIILYTGLKAVGKGITLISGSMVLLIATLIAATITHEKSTLQNLWQAQWPNMLPVFNIAVFCFSAQYMVPEIARGNKDTPRRLAPAIIAGIAGSFILLAAVPAAVISLDGMENLSQVATITWGTTLGVWAYYTANVFALLAMLTSYWGLSGSLVSNIFDHFMIDPLRVFVGIGAVGDQQYGLGYAAVIGKRRGFEAFLFRFIGQGRPERHSVAQTAGKRAQGRGRVHISDAHVFFAQPQSLEPGRHQVVR